MALTATVQVRVDAETKKAADDLFTSLGLDTPTAIRMFLSKSVSIGGLPFNVGNQPEKIDEINNQNTD